MTAAVPLLSIVTVTYNASSVIRDTIESVLARKSSEVEYVVVDGGSTDDTVEIVRSFGAAVDIFTSEPDDGIYDAMNRGIALSRGKYLLFLNAGDRLVTDLDQLFPFFQKEPSLVYGKARMLNPDGTLSYIKGKRLSSERKLLKGMRLCHQAVFFRRDTLEKGYDTSFRIIADRVVIYRIMKGYGAGSSCFVDTVICDYVEGGMSGRNYLALREEEVRFLLEERKYLLAACKIVGNRWKLMR